MKRIPAGVNKEGIPVWVSRAWRFGRGRGGTAVHGEEQEGRGKNSWCRSVAGNSHETAGDRGEKGSHE